MYHNVDLLILNKNNIVNVFGFEKHCIYKNRYFKIIKKNHYLYIDFDKNNTLYLCIEEDRISIDYLLIDFDNLKKYKKVYK